MMAHTISVESFLFSLFTYLYVWLRVKVKFDAASQHHHQHIVTKGEKKKYDQNE